MGPNQSELDRIPASGRSAVLGRPSSFRCLFKRLIPLFALPSAVAAQVTVEVLPYAGLYLPTQPLVDQFGRNLFCYASPCQLTLKQKAEHALGGRLTLWWTSKLGAEATFAYSPSGVTTTPPLYTDLSAHVTTASARAIMRFSPNGGASWLRLGGGLGFVSRGGGAYREWGTQLTSVCGTSRFAAVVSAGVGFKFGRSGLALRLDAEDYLYTEGLYVNGETPGCGNPYQSQCRGLGQVCNFFEGASVTNKFQDDLVLSVGLSLRLGGR